MADRRLSKAGLDDLTVSEGFSKSLYDDGGRGKGHCTIGYGHLVHYGICDGKKKEELEFIEKGISKKEALSHLATDVKWAEKAVNKAVTVELSQGQFDALVSFVYNIGSGNFSRSTVLKNINAKVFDKVPNSIRLWNKSSGIIMQGLVNRREREINRFNGGSAK